jgi:hypothetical protein
MGRPNQATQAKRRRELKNQERQADKRAARAVRKEQKKIERENAPSGVDPDLIGIFPGPQPQVDG